MEKGRVVLVCLIFLSFCLSCRMVETLSGGESAGTVDRLWTDVPAFDGATKADMAIPLAARMALRTMMQGKLNFIAFTTNRNAQEVQDFYSNERMHAAGWKPSETGCVGDTEDKASQGLVCFFDREESGKKEGLAIIVAQDEKSNQTDIFYARIDLTEEAKTPSS